MARGLRAAAGRSGGVDRDRRCLPRRLDRDRGRHGRHDGPARPADDAAQQLFARACHRRHRRVGHAGADHPALDRDRAFWARWWGTSTPPGRRRGRAQLAGCTDAADLPSAHRPSCRVGTLFQGRAAPLACSLPFSTAFTRSASPCSAPRLRRRCSSQPPPPSRLTRGEALTWYLAAPLGLIALVVIGASSGNHRRTGRSASRTMPSAKGDRILRTNVSEAVPGLDDRPARAGHLGRLGWRSAPRWPRPGVSDQGDSSDGR